MNESIKVIIDTDPGVDDAIAILMALVWPRIAPNIELVGITTVGGNVALARATRNALALLEYAGRQDLPVAQGASRPLSGRYGYSHKFHGQTGLSRRLPRPTSQAINASAVEYLAHQLQRQPGQCHLIALGPLTNLSQLMAAHPHALSQAASIVVMGGAVEVPGNVTPHAEFNFYSDPVAANEVISSGIPLTLVDLSACRQAFIGRDEVENLKSASPVGRLVVQILLNWFRKDLNRQLFEFYDPLALAVALRPGLIARRQLEVVVETSDLARLGRSKVVSNEGPVAVANDVDGEAFAVLLYDLFELTRR